MRLVGRGHPAIRASHGKTLELVGGTDLTERGTCVVAVGVEPARDRVAGPVRITITAAGRSFALTARANPSWDPSGPAVIRRSPLRLPGTLATHATAAASDLPRDLVAALRDAATEVIVDVEPVAGPPTAVLFAVDPEAPDDPRLAAELAAADLVVAEDDRAAAMTGERVAHGPVDVTGRVLVLATRELPGATVLAALADPAVAVETVGLAPAQAAAAASPSRGPILVARADPELLRSAPAGTRLVLVTPADRVAALLRTAAEIRGTTGAVLVEDFAPPRRIDAHTELPGRDLVHVALDAAPRPDAIDPAVRAAVTGLLADGVSTKVAAKALAALTGWERRRAYDTVLSWPT